MQPEHQGIKSLRLDLETEEKRNRCSRMHPNLLLFRKEYFPRPLLFERALVGRHVYALVQKLTSMQALKTICYARMLKSWIDLMLLMPRLCRSAQTAYDRPLLVYSFIGKKCVFVSGSLIKLVHYGASYKTLCHCLQRQ